MRILSVLSILFFVGCSTTTPQGRQITIGEPVPEARPAFIHPVFQLPQRRLVEITDTKTGVIQMVTPKQLKFTLVGNLLQVAGNIPEVVRFQNCYLHQSAVPEFLKRLTAALPVGEALSDRSLQALAEKVVSQMAKKSGTFIASNPDLAFRL